MKQAIGEFLLRRLQEAGIKHIFGVPGDYNLALLQQLEDTGALKWIGTCNELNASYAADGYRLPRFDCPCLSAKAIAIPPRKRRSVPIC